MHRSELIARFTPVEGSAPVAWAVSPGLVPYEEAVAAMERRVASIARAEAAECVWLLEHPPIYTAGTSARQEDLTDARFPVHRTGRGGQYTYHGPGQRVVYVMLDLKRRHSDVRAFVAALEAWVVATLAVFGVRGEVREERVGVWVPRSGGREDKIAALGVRIRQGVSFHGVAINVAPDLAHFGGIVPCGVRADGLGVTSLADLGVEPPLQQFDVVLREQFETIFGPTADDGAVEASTNGQPDPSRRPTIYRGETIAP